MMKQLYAEEVHCIRIASAIAGPGEETTTLAKCRESGGILTAFANDDDIQQITVVSTNIGMVRRYTKQYAQE